MRIYIAADKKTVPLESLPTTPIASAAPRLRLFALAHGFTHGNITTAPNEFWIWRGKKTIKHFKNSDLSKFEFPY